MPAIFRTAWWASVAIAAARRLFRNTPVQRLDIVTRVYRFMFARVRAPHQDIAIDYLGLRFLVPSDDITIVPSLVAGDYEHEEFAALERALQPGMTVVDVGANVGIHAAFFGSRVGPQGTVCAFEPEPATDVVKIDVEGYEPQVLAGFMETIERDRPLLLIEFAPEHLRGCGNQPNAFLSTLRTLYSQILLFRTAGHPAVRLDEAEAGRLRPMSSGSWNLLCVPAVQPNSL